MEQGSVARRKPSQSNLLADLQTLNQLVPEDLFLPSLRDRPVAAGPDQSCDPTGVFGPEGSETQAVWNLGHRTAQARSSAASPRAAEAKALPFTGSQITKPSARATAISAACRTSMPRALLQVTSMDALE